MTVRPLAKTDRCGWKGCKSGQSQLASQFFTAPVKPFQYRNQRASIAWGDDKQTILFAKHDKATKARYGTDIHAPVCQYARSLLPIAFSVQFAAKEPRETGRNVQQQHAQWELDLVHTIRFGCHEYRPRTGLSTGLGCIVNVAAFATAWSVHVQRTASNSLLPLRCVVSNLELGVGRTWRRRQRRTSNLRCLRLSCRRSPTRSSPTGSYNTARPFLDAQPLSQLHCRLPARNRSASNCRRVAWEKKYPTHS